MGVCATWTRDWTACTHAWHACVHKLIHALRVTWTRDLTTSNGFDTPLATVYICTRTCMCMATRICVYVYVSKYVCMYVCMSVCTPHACMRPCMCTYVHVYCTYTHTNVQAHRQARTSTQGLRVLGVGCMAGQDTKQGPMEVTILKPAP